MTLHPVCYMIAGHLGLYVYLTSRPHACEFEMNNFEFLIAGVADISFNVV